MEPDEDVLEAARRELDEELGLEVESVGELIRSVSDDDSPFVIEFYPVSVRGTPVAREHSEVGWFRRADAVKLPLAPADRIFAEGLTTRA